MSHISAYKIQELIPRGLSRRVRPIFNRRTLPLKLTRSIVSFTFDDFPVSAITNGANSIEREGWRGTFYTAAGLANISNHHGEHYSAQDLLNLEAKGHEIAGHTHGHTDLTQISAPQVMSEISANRIALKNMGVKGNIDNFAYPFGEVSGQLKRVLSTQFSSMRGIQDGAHYGQADLNELKSQALDSKAHLDTAMRIIKELQARPGWLILFTHDITPNPSQWGCTPRQFGTIVRAVKESGAHVLPVSDALFYLRGENDIKN